MNLFAICLNFCCKLLLILLYFQTTKHNGKTCTEQRENCSNRNQIEGLDCWRWKSLLCIYPRLTKSSKTSCDQNRLVALSLRRKHRRSCWPEQWCLHKKMPTRAVTSWWCCLTTSTCFLLTLVSDWTEQTLDDGASPCSLTSKVWYPMIPTAVQQWGMLPTPGDTIKWYSLLPKRHQERNYSADTTLNIEIQKEMRRTRRNNMNIGFNVENPKESHKGKISCTRSSHDLRFHCSSHFKRELYNIMGWPDCMPDGFGYASDAVPNVGNIRNMIFIGWNLQKREQDAERREKVGWQ